MNFDYQSNLGRGSEKCRVTLDHAGWDRLSLPDGFLKLLTVRPGICCMDIPHIRAAIIMFIHHLVILVDPKLDVGHMLNIFILFLWFCCIRRLRSGICAGQSGFLLNRLTHQCLYGLCFVQSHVRAGRVIPKPFLSHTSWVTEGLKVERRAEPMKLQNDDPLCSGANLSSVL